MNIFELIFEVVSGLTDFGVGLLDSFGSKRSDNDRSIVGESPMEQDLARFWRRVGLLLLLAGLIAALCIWVISPLIARARERDRPLRPLSSGSETERRAP